MGDLFNDGKMEAVVENLLGQPMILRPEGGPPNHWISFQLQGVKCNRLALNARVRATAGDLVQLGEVRAEGAIYRRTTCACTSVWAAIRRLDKAEVLWPDGNKEILTNLAADRFYVVREGQGVISNKPPEHSTNLP